jgi:hypothetical protein
MRPQAIQGVLLSTRVRADACFRRGMGMCYNQMAVRDTGKQEMAPAEARGTTVVDSLTTRREADVAAALGYEDASRYCPVCSQRLESRRCKLACGVCGYYMSCADYY